MCPCMLKNWAQQCKKLLPLACLANQPIWQSRERLSGIFPPAHTNPSNDTTIPVYSGYSHTLAWTRNRLQNGYQQLSLRSHYKRNNAYINSSLQFNNCWFSHDVTKIQTTKLSILLKFYFHDVLEQLKTNFHTNFCFKRVLGFVIEYAFTWRPRELSCRLKKWLISGNFAI